MRGSLWRCTNCQMRSATREESLGAEIVNRYLGDMKLDLLKKRGARKFVDVAKEGVPRFEDLSAEQEIATMIAPVAQPPPVEPQRPLTMTAAAADAVDALQPRTPRRERRRPLRDPDTMDTVDSVDTMHLPEPHSEPSASSASAAPLTPLPPHARFHGSGTGGSVGPATPVNPRMEDASRVPPIRSPPMPFPFPQERRSGPYTSFQEELPTSDDTAVYYIDLGYQDRPDPPEASALIFRATEAEA